jgi:hypothetical protein
MLYLSWTNLDFSAVHHAPVFLLPTLTMGHLSTLKKKRDRKTHYWEEEAGTGQWL